MLIVMTTVPDPGSAEKLAEAIVGERLAVCVQILPPMTSVYVWDGEVRWEPEHLMLIKTLPERYDELERFITEHHSYEVPEIVAIESERVSTPYFDWLRENLG